MVKKIFSAKNKMAAMARKGQNTNLAKNGRRDLNKGSNESPRGIQYESEVKMTYLTI